MRSYNARSFDVGGIAQLGERLHGMQEVSGSIPLTSTKESSSLPLSPSSRGLGHRPFTAITGVRIPVGTPVKWRSFKQVLMLVPMVGYNAGLQSKLEW